MGIIFPIFKKKSEILKTGQVLCKIRHLIDGRAGIKQMGLSDSKEDSRTPVDIDQGS